MIYNTEQEPERNIQTGTGKDSFVMVLMVERYPGFFYHYCEGMIHPVTQQQLTIIMNEKCKIGEIMTNDRESTQRSQAQHHRKMETETSFEGGGL